MKLITVFIIICISSILYTVNASLNNEDNFETWYIALKVSDKSKKFLEKYLLDISDPDSKNYGLYLQDYNIEKIVQVPMSDKLTIWKWLAEKNVRNYCKIYVDVIVCKNVPKNLTICKNEPKHHLDCDIDDNSIENIVEFIDLVHMKNNNKKITNKKINNKNVDSGYVGKEPIQKLYNYNWDNNNKKVSVGVVEFDNNRGFSQRSVESIQAYNDVQVHDVQHVIGNNRQPVNGESALDVSMIAQLSGENSDMWFWDEQTWLYQFSVDFLQSANYPEVISLSWGWSEANQCGNELGNCTISEIYVNRVNYEFMKISSRGTTIIVSSGDSGSPGRTNMECKNDINNKPLNPDFPASSNYVLSVGGTYVLSNYTNQYNYSSPLCTKYVCSNGNKEGISSYSTVQWASGSGFSNYLVQNDWQISEVSNYLNQNITFPNSTYYNKTGRAYPDVVAVSNQCPVFDNKGIQLMPFAGTSCSAPIWAAFIARINAHRKKTFKKVVGFVNPVLYKIKKMYPNCFNTIIKGNTRSTETKTCGSDFGFETTGTNDFNLVSGLGSPNLDCILKVINNII